MNLSSVSAELPTSFDRFREVWQLDFEFRTDSCHRPQPIAMYCREMRSGAEIQLRRPQLLALRRAPFDVSADVLVTSYSIVAELNCFAMLRWPAPRNVICTYFETAAAVNGLALAGLETKRPSLLEAC